jgi:hypothetical protein
LFTEVLLVCARQGLIGRELFAIDGVKLPSNASKAKSGTRKEMSREVSKMRRAVAKLLAKHREEDEAETTDTSIRTRELRRIERLERDAKKVSEWLKAHPEDRRGGARNKVRKSNRTDNDSAKMATSKGVIQGYTAVAAVDEKHQIIVEAQAHEVGQEQELLAPVIEALKPLVLEKTVISADSGYHSKDNVKALTAQQIEAFIPDNGYRKRDRRYAGQAKHRAKPEALWNKTQGQETDPIHARRFPDCARSLARDLSGGQAALPQRRPLQDRRLCGGEVHRHQARLCSVSSARPVLTSPAP